MKEQTNNQITRWMKIAIEVGILLFAVALAWSTIRGDVAVNTKDIGKHDIRIATFEKEHTNVKADIREIKVMQRVIGGDIKEIKESLK